MTLPIAIAIVASTLIVGSAIFILLSRFSPHGGREDKTPTSVYAVTAGAMSLLIAFTLSLTFTQYLSAQQAASQEADAIISMSRAATFMAPEVRDPLRDQLVCYAQQTIDLEWPALRNHDVTMLPQLRQTLNTMDGILATHVTAAGPGLSLWEGANEQRLNAHVQILQAADDNVPPILWLLLVAGSIITIGSLFVYADRGKPSWGHALVVIGPLFIASAALVVIAFFDHPFENTPGAIKPVAMELALDRLTHDRIADIPLPVCLKKS